MKKSLKIALSCIFILILVIIILWHTGLFLYDPSAEIYLEYVSWNGREYSNISGSYTEGKRIVKGKKAWEINAVEEDPSHTFIVARTFLDQRLLVADDYNVPTEGKLTTVSWDDVYITDPLFLEAITKIEAEKTTSFTYETNGIYVLRENQHMRSLYFAYDNCPVTTNFIGYMGKVNGEWVITTYISEYTRNKDGSPKWYPVSCYRIPDTYWDILSEYFDK